MCDLTYMCCVKKHTIKIEEVIMKLYNTDFEEQETIIHIDYARSQIHLYSCRKTVIKKLKDKLGEPNKVYKIREQVSGASWTLTFEDKRKITSVLSRPTLIGSVK